MSKKVALTITGAGHYSIDVMNQIAGQLQQYLLEEETIQPNNVLIKFSTEYLAQVVFIPKVDEIPAHTEPKPQVLISANVPITTLKTKTTFKEFLNKLFGHYGTVILTDEFETVWY